MEQIDLIKNRLAPINNALVHVLPEARNQALAAMDAIHSLRSEVPALYANTFLASARKQFQEDGAEDWELIHGTNCLHLRDKETGMVVRFIKQFAFTKELPPAGRNRNRIKVWSQQDLRTLSMEPLFDALKLERVNIIVAWGELENGNFVCTAYQPLGAGSYPKGAPALSVMEMPLALPEDDYSDLTGEFDGTRQNSKIVVPRRNIVVGKH